MEQDICIGQSHLFFAQEFGNLLDSIEDPIEKKLMHLIERKNRAKIYGYHFRLPRKKKKEVVNMFKIAWKNI